MLCLFHVTVTKLLGCQKLHVQNWSYRAPALQLHWTMAKACVSFAAGVHQ